ncbi:MAG: energy-dependent translational throttle protein EttA [Planctomycetes bacterium]|jgi:ATP-binding cassette ChvD family protein|nr:energy-dependent translational throttle protein EttA [Planctomycetota bacterium]MCP4839093.1 energy-dependent translational throttle protein EttA [Planctomycetota bacterium]
MPDIIYSMLGVSKTIEKRTIIKDISLSYFYGAKIGVLGLNGAGKSTVLKIMAGVDTEFDGQVQKVPGFTVGYLEQEPLLGETRTVREVVEEGMQETVDLMREFDRINEAFAEPMDDDAMQTLLDRQSEVQEALDAANAWDLDSRLEMAMDALRCPPDDRTVDTLSGGERRRVALCRLLLSSPDILLLDEPTNHLDAESVAWLEQHLQRYAGTIIAVTHDRYFLDNVAGWILELDRGEGIPWEGNYSSWLEQKQQRLAIESRHEGKRQKALQRELEWVRRSPQARQAKSQARITAYENLMSQDRKEQERAVEIFVPPGPRLGDLVIDVKGVSKAYGDTVLVDDMDFSLPPGAIVGIIGPNGAGKTTLFRMLVGDESPDNGEVRIGETVVMACAQQGRDALPNARSVWEAVSDGDEEIDLGGIKVNSRAYVSKFGFPGTMQQRQVGTLSGGERNRVQLACTLREGANVLLLDEPTNDLDVNTIRAIEEGLESFGGTALIISHDRWFLDRVATHILAFEGDSKVRFFYGNWTAYDEDRRKRLGAASEQPHRIKYRKLTR